MPIGVHVTLAKQTFNDDGPAQIFGPANPQNSRQSVGR
jgi:hypothetical protein